ncbi:hypothetical protein STEG23_005002 [Scotinomys teguina]
MEDSEDGDHDAVNSDADDVDGDDDCDVGYGVDSVKDGDDVDNDDSYHVVKYNDVMVTMLVMEMIGVMLTGIVVIVVVMLLLLVMVCPESLTFGQCLLVSFSLTSASVYQAAYVFALRVEVTKDKISAHGAACANCWLRIEGIWSATCSDEKKGMEDCIEAVNHTMLSQFLHLCERVVFLPQYKADSYHRYRDVATIALLPHIQCKVLGFFFNGHDLFTNYNFPGTDFLRVSFRRKWQLSQTFPIYFSFAVITVKRLKEASAVCAVLTITHSEERNTFQKTSRK